MHFILWTSGCNYFYGFGGGAFLKDFVKIYTVKLLLLLNKKSTPSASIPGERVFFHLFTSQNARSDY